MMIRNRVWLQRLGLSAMMIGGLGADIASGADRLNLMNWPAVHVRDPTQAVLVSVARAGSRLIAVGEHGLIITSNDNGRSWVQALVPTSETITCVAFVNATDGWAAGGQGVVLHSTDGGRHWKIQLTGDQMLSMMTKAAGAFLAAAPDDEDAKRAVRRAGILAQAGDDKPVLTIFAVDPQDVTLFGAYRIAVRTRDGGKTWADWSLHVGDPFSHNIYQTALVNKISYLTGEAGSVLRADPQVQNYTMVTIPDQNTFLGILGTAKSALLTYGIAGESFRSTDQGQTWTQSQSPDTADLTSGIILTSGNILLSSEDGNVLVSRNDGESFSNVGPNLGMGIFGLTQASNGDVVFVGSAGVRVERASTFDGNN